MKNKKQHIIFEGAELVGKSFFISQIFDVLEKKYNTSNKILNGCHWFNCDNGVFGSSEGKKIIDEYIKILEVLKDKNVIFEKFHLSDAVYNQIYNKKKISYSKEENILKEMDTRLVLITVESVDVFKNRILDRLKNTPEYKRILQKPNKYWMMQEKYIEMFEKSSLEKIRIDMSFPLDKKFVKKQTKKVLSFLGEK